ncbi:TetR family transcriptional regulator [Micromonospora echinaurantiaca]|uniref:acyl-CoA-like ligand-binding transcription factor n=1 Tax=Micromonospora echinaurantiaca TaxID=47857 RepID=UPI0037AE972E
MSSPGLRERKKQKTRWSIQEHALRLFREQGYEDTTVDQIAAAAEVSPSTFFRYFKTKEDVVLHDEWDPVFVRYLTEAPAGLSLVAAMRYALREGLADFDDADRTKTLQRADLMLRVPAVRMRLLDNVATTIDLIAEAAAARTGEPAGSARLRAYAGACCGALLGAMSTWLASDRSADPIQVMDQALAELEAGFGS